MNDYGILIGLCPDSSLGTAADKAVSDRYAAIVMELFSLGPAWQGNQRTVLLRSALSHQEIVERVSALVAPGDLVVVLEGRATSVTAIGWNADVEGLDAIYPNTCKRPDFN